MSATISELLSRLCPAMSVGAISAEVPNLGRDCEELQKAGAGILHFDVIDGLFAPQLTAGPFFVKGLKTPLLKDVHLMINDPLKTIADFAAAGADMITVHVESCGHVHRVLQAIGALANVNDAGRGIARGLALNPGTPLEVIEPLLDEIDMVCLLAVNPGFAGQRFIEKTLERFARLKVLLAETERRIFTCLDGGITRANIAMVAAAGADIVVSGSAIFERRAIGENVSFFANTLKGTL
ncbi:MAG: ribulose-phosphate 3-epimerase [Chitinivibrionales bacterium]|nr:ribulose-phosphate 3-epimerase [Chitinivibrionales bacterium]